MVEQALPLARKAARVLEENGLQNARLEAELLLAEVLGVSRLELYLQFDRPIRAVELESFRAMVRRRLRREPLQYIVGHVAFRELELRVDRRVLIPRPETEVLVGEVLRWAAEREKAAAERAGLSAGRDRSAAQGSTGLEALDVGTGSGAIALSLAHEGRFRRVVATDASGEALEVARANAERLGLAADVEFRCGDLWSALAPDERYDAVVSNPPYVAHTERGELAPEVSEWEPPDALFAAEEGYGVLKALVAGALRFLRPCGLLALETGVSQASEVARRIAATEGYTGVRIVEDLTGRPRVVLATVGPEATERDS